MTAKKLVSIASAAAFAAVCCNSTTLSAQSAPPAADNDKESLQMVVNYGQGKEKKRHSHQGVMEPTGLALHQPATITLQFSKKKAGEAVTVSPLDGGKVTASWSNLSVLADGTVVFSFQADGTPGLYRLVVQLATETHELSFYAFDPDRPANPRRIPGSH